MFDIGALCQWAPRAGVALRSALDADLDATAVAIWLLALALAVVLKVAQKYGGVLVGACHAHGLGVRGTFDPGGPNRRRGTVAAEHPASVRLVVEPAWL